MALSKKMLFATCFVAIALATIVSANPKKNSNVAEEFVEIEPKNVENR